MSVLTPPERLYRFRSASTDHFYNELVEAVDNHKVWCHPVNLQNDPFDALPSFCDSTEEELSQFLTVLRKHQGSSVNLAGGNWKELLKSRAIPVSRDIEKWVKTQRRNLLWQADITVKSFLGVRENTKIAAFCNNSNSLLLWSHYADAHKGIRLEYGWMQNGSVSYPFAPLVPVKYCKARPKISKLDACKYVWSVRLNNEKIVSQTFSNEILEKSVHTKSNDWAYEEEWRYVETDEKGPGYKVILPLKVISISCGVAASEETVSSCLMVAKEANRVVPVYKCELCPDKYEIIYKRIN